MTIIEKYKVFSIVFCCIFLLSISNKLSSQEFADTLTVNSMAYSKQEEWKRTSAISTVSGEELMKTTATSVGNALHGRLAGLTVLQQSGEPGYDFFLQDLYSRGQSSYMGGQKILVFVDGFESPIERLTATEVESITLLKDAAALALYGMRGANGVLLVTTKKGLASASQIDIRLQTGIQQPTFLTDPVDAYTYASLYNQARINDGLPTAYSQDALNAYKNGSDPYFYPNVNWKNEIIKNSTPLNLAELSFRGGNNVVGYYVMMNFLQNQGFYKGTDNKRRENSNAYYASFNFRTNLDINVNRNLLASVYFSGSVGDRSLPGGGSSASDIFNSMWRVPANAFPVYNPNESFGGSNLFTNPVGDILSKGLYKENSRTFQIVSNLKYDFSQFVTGLSLSGGVAFNNYMADSSPKIKDYVRYEIKPNGTDINGNPIIDYTQYGVDAALVAQEGFRTDWSRTNIKAQLDYSRTFGDHGIDLLGLFVSEIFETYNVRDDLKYLNYAGRLTYNYKKKYIAELSAAYTGSDNFPRNSRFGLFPAFSLGWVLSKEQFIKNTGFDGFLKLRTSYGIVGNDQMGTGRFLFDQTYSGKGSYYFGTGSSASSGFGEDVLANRNITWEKKNVFNVGFDMSLKNSFFVQFDYFNEQRSDILAQPFALVPGFVGASWGNILPYMNVGQVKNSGFELTVNYKKKITSDFSYFLEPSVWFAKNEIINMDEEIKLFDYQYRKGHSIGTPFVLVADGFYKESDFDQDGNLIGGLPKPIYGVIKPGDLKYIDQNNDKIIDSNDAYPVGYSNIPEWNYAFRFGFSWARFDFEALVHGVANRDVYFRGPLAYSFTNNGTASPLAIDSWTPQNPNASYPRLSTISFDNNYRYSTFWKKSGDYLRLRNIQFGYSLPESIIAPLKLSKIYIYVNIVNLLTINQVDNMFDPESNLLITYPLTKSYNIGLKMDF